MEHGGFGRFNISLKTVVLKYLFLHDQGDPLVRVSFHRLRRAHRHQRTFRTDTSGVGSSRLTFYGEVAQVTHCLARFFSWDHLIKAGRRTHKISESSSQSLCHQHPLQGTTNDERFPFFRLAPKSFLRRQDMRRDASLYHGLLGYTSAVPIKSRIMWRSGVKMPTVLGRYGSSLRCH